MAVGSLIDRLHHQAADDDEPVLDGHTVASTALSMVSNKTAAIAALVDEDGEQDKRATQIAKTARLLNMSEDNLKDWLAEECPALHNKINECGSTAVKAGVGLAGTIAGAALIPVPIIGSIPLVGGLIAGGLGGIGSTMAYGYFTGDNSAASEELAEARRLIKSGVRPAAAFQTIERRLSGEEVDPEEDIHVAHDLPPQAQNPRAYRAGMNPSLS